MWGGARLSGMTSDHLYPVLESEAALLTQWPVCSQLVRHLMTSWRPSGWVVSQHFRNQTEVCEGLLSVTSMAKQISKRVEAATAPFQHALKTRCESVAHVLQTLTDLDPEAVMSFDGVGAYDLISRNAMLEGLLRCSSRGSMTDPQSGYLLLLMCGSTRANFWLRALRPEDTESFARRHDENMPSSDSWHAKCPSWCAHFGDPRILWAWIGKRCKSASCCTFGELGRLPSHGPSASPSCCRSHDRRVAGQCSVEVSPVRQCRQVVLDAGLEMPPWQELADTPPPRPEEPEQQRASRKLEERFLREEVWPGLRALLCSQYGTSGFCVFDRTPHPRPPGLMLNLSVSSCADACTCPSVHVFLANVAACQIWPSSCSVRLGRGIGEKASRWRSLRPKYAERPELEFPPTPRPRHGRVQQLGWTASGGCRRRSHSVARCAACHRHDLGLSSPL